MLFNFISVNNNIGWWIDIIVLIKITIDWEKTRQSLCSKEFILQLQCLTGQHHFKQTPVTWRSIVHSYMKTILFRDVLNVKRQETLPSWVSVIATINYSIKTASNNIYKTEFLRQTLVLNLKMISACWNVISANTKSGSRSIPNVEQKVLMNFKCTVLVIRLLPL